MIQVQLWLSILLIPICSILASTWGSIPGRAGLGVGVALLFATISGVFRGLETEPPKSGAPRAREIAAPFPWVNCLWGPLSLVAGAAIYSAVSSIMDAPLFVPPLHPELSALPELATTFDKALDAFRIGVPIAATLALPAALVRDGRGGVAVAPIAWAPVLAATMPCFMLAFGITHFTQIVFAAAAVTLTGLAYFVRTYDEAASAPVAAGRIMFFVLEAIYASFVAGLAAVIVIEFISGRDGVGYSIVMAIQLLNTARAVAAIALVWLAVAFLSFAVRLLQSIATRV
jgi:hypothetical protein